jgi:multiple sugar transport system permease protein
MILLIGILYPFLVGVYWSLTDYKLIAKAKHFIGLANYWSMITSEDFAKSMRVEGEYAFLVLIIEMPLGLFVALMLNRQFPGFKVYRTILCLPLMMPPVIAALMWKAMMLPDGVLNYILGFVGIQRLDWLGHPQSALPSIVLMDVWLYTPFAALVFLAGLQSIPREPYEAAMVDGASTLTAFRTITLPMLAPFLIIVGVFRGIDSLKIFDLIYATTQGGPVYATTSLALEGYFQGIRWMNFGVAMCYSLVLWAICYAFSFYFIRRWQKAAVSKS